MRQLRIQSELCKKKLQIENRSMTCQDDYAPWNEERRTFSPGWVNTNMTANSTASIQNAFRYRSSQELDSYVYAGQHGQYAAGGYVYEFRGSLANIRQNISELHRLGWIDEQTRAIFIQTSLYNPNVNLFTSVTVVVEILATGNFFPSARFEPIDLLSTFRFIFQ